LVIDIRFFVIGYGLFESNTIALSIVNELAAGKLGCQEAGKL